MREHARAAQPLNISLRIAARVRELSLGQGLTLDALAAQCAVSLDVFLDRADQPSFRDLFA